MNRQQNKISTNFSQTAYNVPNLLIPFTINGLYIKSGDRISILATFSISFFLIVNPE